MVRYVIPSVESELKLERHCSHCYRPNGNIHTGIQYRGISDTKVTAIARQRMRCPFCGTTWTIRPEGVGSGRHRSERLLSIGVILYMFGLSYCSVEKFLPFLEARGSNAEG